MDADKRGTEILAATQSEPGAVDAADNAAKLVG